jgi:Zn-dependent protease
MNMNNILNEIVLMAVPVLFSITVHEVSHGYVAYLFGDPTAKSQGRLTLNPIKHIDPVGLLVLFITRMVGWAKPVPVDHRYFKNPRRDMIWVSLAGPTSNIILAVITAFVLKLTGHYLTGTYLEPLIPMGQIMVMINVGLAIFNLIPIPPLDGSHILSGLLPVRLAYSYSKIQPYGFIILLALIFTHAVDVVISPVIQTIVAVLLT